VIAHWDITDGRSNPCAARKAKPGEERVGESV
jgi:hypothetical protein